MSAKIKEHSNNDQRQPPAADGVVVVQHRRQISQRRVWHEEKTQDRPEQRVERRLEPVREKRNEDEQQAREKHGDDRY